MEASEKDLRHKEFPSARIARSINLDGIILNSSKVIILTGFIGLILLLAALGCSNVELKPDQEFEKTVDARSKDPTIPRLSTSTLPNTPTRPPSPIRPVTPELAISPSVNSKEVPVSTISPTAASNPAPTATNVPTQVTINTETSVQPEAITIPLLESFSGLVSVVKQVGQLIQKLEWGLINNSNESITVLAATTQDSRGNLVVKITSDFIANEWSGGEVAASSKLVSITDFKTPLPLDELLSYQWVWTLKSQTGSIIVCTFDINADSCISTDDGPNIDNDRPDVKGVLLTINGQLIVADQIAVPIDNGYVMVHPMADSDGSYPRSTEVTLGYYPNVAETQGVWSGVDSVSGQIAEIEMNSDREVTVTAGQ